MTRFGEILPFWRKFKVFEQKLREYVKYVAKCSPTYFGNLFYYVCEAIETRLVFNLKVFIQLNYKGITTVYIWRNLNKTIVIEK